VKNHKNYEKITKIKKKYKHFEKTKLENKNKNPKN